MNLKTLFTSRRRYIFAILAGLAVPLAFAPFNFIPVIFASLAVLFGVWCLGQYRDGNGAGSLISAVAAFGVSVGLMVYDSWFLRKTRTL